MGRLSLSSCGGRSYDRSLVQVRKQVRAGAGETSGMQSAVTIIGTSRLRSLGEVRVVVEEQAIRRHNDKTTAGRCRSLPVASDAAKSGVPCWVSLSLDEYLILPFPPPNFISLDQRRQLISDNQARRPLLPLNNNIGCPPCHRSPAWIADWRLTLRDCPY